jgi:hypothetical protein
MSKYQGKCPCAILSGPERLEFVNIGLLLMVPDMPFSTFVLPMVNRAWSDFGKQSSPISIPEGLVPFAAA